MRDFLKFISVFTLVGLAGCASSPTDVANTSYTRSEISILASNHFNVKDSALNRALKPSFAKYGQPKGYVLGQMSAAHEDDKDRLMGTGIFQAKFKLSKGTYWEIDGHGLKKLNKPLPAMHLVYHDTDITKFKSALTNSDVIFRKDQTFTVFEQKVDEQVLVTVYRTADIPESSNMDTLTFAPTYRGGLLP